MNKASPDSRGYVPNLKLIGCTFRHFKGQFYILQDYIYDAERDLWEVVYSSQDGKHYTRSISNFFGVATIEGREVQRFVKGTR